MGLLKFEKVKTDGEDTYIIYNSKEEYIGLIKKERTGRFIHWCLVIPFDLMNQAVSLKQYLTFSPGCQDEIREFCRKLNGNNKGA